MLFLRPNTCLDLPQLGEPGSGCGSEHKGEEDTALGIKGPGILVAKSIPNPRSLYLFKEKATHGSSLVEGPRSAVGLEWKHCAGEVHFSSVYVNPPTSLNLPIPQVIDCL